MKFEKIEVVNVLGLARADITMNTGITLVAGANMSGKSSLRDAVHMAFTGQPSRVSLKKDLGQILHDGAKKGRCTVTVDGDVGGTISLPDGKQVAAEFPGGEYLPLLLDPSAFASMKPDERKKLLFKLTKCKVSMEVIEPMLVKRGVDMKLFEDAKPEISKGFPAACEYAKDQAKEAKGAWRLITGENYGSDKAEGWKPAADEGPAVTQKDLDAKVEELAELNKNIDNGNRAIGELNATAQAQASNVEKRAMLTEKAGQIERHKAKLANTAADLDKWTAAVKKAQDEVAAHNGESSCECPGCGVKLKVVGQGVEIFKGKTADSKKLAAAKSDLAIATDSLKLIETTHRNDLALVAGAEQAALDLAALEDTKAEDVEQKLITYADAVGELQDKRANAQIAVTAITDRLAEIADAGKKEAEAAAYHGKVTKWLEIAEALAPDGIPAELLGKAIDPINQSLELLSGMAGWPLVTITKEIDITSNGYLYALNSKSEQWRADALIALAIAQISGLKVVVLDGFDVLEIPARTKLIGMLCKLVKLGNIETALVMGTLKNEGMLAGMPPEVTTVWISNAIAETAQ